MTVDLEQRPLLELTRAGASNAELDAEGFTPLEQATARAQVNAETLASRRLGRVSPADAAADLEKRAHSEDEGRGRAARRQIDTERAPHSAARRARPVDTVPAV